MNNKEIAEIVSSWAKSETSVSQAWLFGSWAKGKEKPDSDVDIAIVLRPDGDRSADAIYITNRENWSSLLADIIGFEVDLQIITEDDKIVGPAVQEHGLKLYEDTAHETRHPEKQYP